MSTAKIKRTRAEDEARDKKIDAALEKAAAATAKEIKVSVTVRLDSDIYMALHDRAEGGEAGGKYQRILNNILREHLFSDEKPRRETEAEKAIKTALKALHAFHGDEGSTASINKLKKRA